MRARQQILRTLLATMVVCLAVSCAKKKGDDPAPEAPSTPTDSGDRGGTGLDPSTSLGDGKNVPFTITSKAAMNRYVKVHPVNNPQQMQLMVDLTNNGNGRYGGTIELSYYDYGQWFTGHFETGSGYNQTSYQNHYTGMPESEFNQWFTWNGKKVFHGFFQDSIGAVILVIDDGLDLGDGGGIINVNGSLYFKNFALTGTFDPPASPEKCWFLMAGPYDCRAFMGAGGFVSTTSALYPGDGYEKLGTFKGLNRPSAFNE